MLGGCQKIFIKIIMDKKKTIRLETIAKQFHDPEKFMKDVGRLHADLKMFVLLYGDIGLKVLLESIRQEP